MQLRRITDELERKKADYDDPAGPTQEHIEPREAVARCVRLVLDGLEATLSDPENRMAPDAARLARMKARCREVLRQARDQILSKLERPEVAPHEASGFFQDLVVTAGFLVKEAKEIESELAQPEPQLPSLLEDFEKLLAGEGEEIVMRCCAQSRQIWAWVSYAYDRDELDFDDLRRAVALLDRARSLPPRSLRDERFRENIRVRQQALSDLLEEAAEQTADINEVGEGFQEDCVNPELTLTEDQRRRLAESRRTEDIAAIDQVWKEAGWIRIGTTRKKCWSEFAGLMKGDPRSTQEIMNDLRG